MFIEFTSPDGIPVSINVDRVIAVHPSCTNDGGTTIAFCTDEDSAVELLESYKYVMLKINSKLRYSKG